MIGTLAGRRRAPPRRRSDRPRARREIEPGKPKPGVSGKSVGPGRYQADFVDRHRGTQVDLDPGGGVGTGINRRVIAVCRARLGPELVLGSLPSCCRIALIWSSSSATAGLVSASIRRASDRDRAATDSRRCSSAVRRSVCRGVS